MKTLTFSWPENTHPRHGHYTWILFNSKGDALGNGTTLTRGVTVTVPADVAESYHVIVWWVHDRTGKSQWHYTSPVQVVELPVEPEPPPPDPDPDPEPPPPDPDPEPPVEFGKWWLYEGPDSRTADREELVPGREYDGRLYIEYEPAGPVAAIQFYIEDELTVRETKAPYTLMGDNSGVLKPWDTRTYPNGVTELRADVEGSGETSFILIEIANAAEEPGPGPDPDPDPDPEPPPPDPDPEPEPPPPGPGPGPGPEPEPPEGEVPELPRKKVDISFPGFTGRVVAVKQGEKIQDAIDAAQPGDKIVPEAGTFVEQLVFDRAFDPPIIVMPEGIPTGRAAPGKLPVKLIGTNHTKNIIGFTSQARGVYIAGIEADYAQGIVDTTGAMVSTHALTSRVIFDRMVISMGMERQIQRALRLNGMDVAAIGCHLVAAKKGFDAQAILIHDGAGPFHIEDCDLVGSGENIMVGGAGCSHALPADVTMLRNHFWRPALWRDGYRTIKNLFEIKFGIRMLMEGNVLENNWKNGQDGHALNIKRSISGLGDQIGDFTFRYNILRDTLHAVKTGSGFPRAEFSNNLIYDLARLWTMISSKDLRLLNNTCIHTSNIITSSSTNNAGTIAIGNVWGAQTGYGVKGNSIAEGTSTLRINHTPYVYRDNGHIGRKEDRYPAGNRFVADHQAARFADDGFRLRADSPFAGLGADIDAVLNATAGVVR